MGFEQLGALLKDVFRYEHPGNDCTPPAPERRWGGHQCTMEAPIGLQMDFRKVGVFLQVRDERFCPC